MPTRARTREVQRLEKILEDAGIKLSSVPSSIMGLSGRNSLNALPNQVLLSDNFRERRGWAMGIAYVGIGIGFFSAPQLAKLLMAANDFNRAAVEYRECLRLEPGNLAAATGLGIALASAGSAESDAISNSPISSVAASSPSSRRTRSRKAACGRPTEPSFSSP